MSIKWRINKMQYVHTMAYYLTTKRNRVLIHTAMWMNHEPGGFITRLYQIRETRENGRTCDGGY